MPPKNVSVWTDNNGYKRVAIKYPHEKRKSKKVPVHRLVLEAFVGLAPNGFECAHLNNKKDDNRLENLKWVTKSENNSMKFSFGTDMRGEKHPFSKFSNDERREIKFLYNFGWWPTYICYFYGSCRESIRRIAKDNKLWNEKS